MKKILLLSSTLILIACITVGAQFAFAATISSSEYSLTAIDGSYAKGMTDWNAVSILGYVNNVTELGAVESLLSDGYTYSAPQTGPWNGIYNWSTSGFHALTFKSNDTDIFTLNEFSFISSRNYGDTPIMIEYALGASGWITAASTTSDTLGITTGAAQTYTIALGGIAADAFRFVTNGGSQVSLHEIMIDGTVGTSAIPEPTTIFLFGFGLLGLAGVNRRKK